MPPFLKRVYIFDEQDSLDIMDIVDTLARGRHIQMYSDFLGHPLFPNFSLKW